MKNLFTYYIRKRLPVVLVAAIVFAIFTIVFLSQCAFERYETTSGSYVVKPVPGDNPFIYLSVLICLIATVIPVMEFTFKMKRRSADLFYSLPLSRIKLYSVKYLLGLVEVLILWFPQWAISFIYVACMPNVFLMHYYLWYALAAIAFAILIYTFMCFFFTMANSTLDGIFFMAMASCLLPFGMNLISAIIARFGGGHPILLSMRYYFIYSPFIDCSYAIYIGMCGSYAEAYAINIPALCAFLALGVISLVLFFLFTSFKNNAESISDDSESYFGYRVLIPAYMVTAFTAVGQQYAVWAIIAMAGYAGYAVYRRNFKIRKWDLFSYFLSVLAGLLFAVIL